MPPNQPNEVAVVQPIRTCIGCRRKATQAELDRIALVNEKLVVSRTAPGRGAWLCRESALCLNTARKKGGFDRAFKRRISPAQAAELQVVFGVTPPNVSH